MTIIEQEYNWAYLPGNRTSTTHLILHHAAAESATPLQVHSWHLANGWAGIAYHYYVRKDGSVYRGRPESWRGGHTTNWNYCSIGICFEGNFEDDEMSEAQRKSGHELVSDITMRYSGIVVGMHKQYQATVCPGRNFPFDEIAGGTTEEPPDTDAEQPMLEPSDWAVESCEKAVETGLIEGNGDGTYGWHDPITKEMFAVLADRLGLLE